MRQAGGLQVPQIIVTQDRELRRAPPIKIHIDSPSSESDDDDNQVYTRTRLRPRPDYLRCCDNVKHNEW